MKDPAGISIAAAEMFEFGSEMRRTLNLLLSIVSMYWRSSSFERQITSSVLQFSPIGGGGVIEGVGLTVESTLKDVAGGCKVGCGFGVSEGSKIILVLTPLGAAVIDTDCVVADTSTDSLVLWIGGLIPVPVLAPVGLGELSNDTGTETPMIREMTSVMASPRTTLNMNVLLEQRHFPGGRTLLNVTSSSVKSSSSKDARRGIPVL